MNARKLLSAAKAVEAAYIEDVFSTYLYTGNGSTQTITNGIDLAGKGGLVWGKRRDGAGYNNVLQDTVRGAGKEIQSDLTNAQITRTDAISSFNSDGFSFTGAGGNQWNQSSGTYVSWTFRKQAKFFDVVTYTGATGNAVQNISHNLGSIPGCIIVKCTDQPGYNWVVYHRSTGATQYTYLNTTAAAGTSSTFWNDTSPTATQFTVGTSGSVNGAGQQYVAYLFAHDAGGFGASGADNVISCGSYTGTGGSLSVSLGWEPQFLLVKRAVGGATDWSIQDTMRGFPVTGEDQRLVPNTSAAEVTSGAGFLFPTATGFGSSGSSSVANNSGDTYIYIAIRRGPMKTPTTGTSVYNAIARTGTGADVTSIGSVGFASDLAIISNTDKVATTANSFMDRLRGGSQYLDSTSTAAENSLSNLVRFDNNNSIGLLGTLRVNGTSYPYINWLFRRAPGFFDVVCTSEDGSFSLKAHNLGVKPELIISKRRSGTQDWYVSRPNPIGKYMVLNSTAAEANINLPATETTFAVAGANTGQTDVSYLFATCPGVSKVGSYTGTGNVLQIDCGFTGGARFVLIKRTDSTGDWYVWDSARGIVAGNDPYLLLNSTAAEVTTTDWVDTHSPGFELSNAGGNNANINTATYIFLAIA